MPRAPTLASFKLLMHPPIGQPAGLCYPSSSTSMPCWTRRVDSMDAQLQQYEARSHDRAVALRAILRDDREMCV